MKKISRSMLAVLSGAMLCVASASAAGTSAEGVTAMEHNLSSAIEANMVARHFKSGEPYLSFMPKTPIIEAHKLDYLYRVDPLVAKEKYDGKEVIVDALIVRRDVSNDGYYYLEGAGIDTSIALVFGPTAKDKTEVMKHKRGDHVRLSCHSYGVKNGFLFLGGCSTQERATNVFLETLADREKVLIEEARATGKVMPEMADSLIEAIRFSAVMPQAGKKACEKNVNTCRRWFNKNQSALKQKLKRNPSAGDARLKELNLK